MRVSDINMDMGKYRYASRRNVVFARNGMACSVSPLASQIGIRILQEGGNAVDAAVAMGMALPLLDPTSHGLGGDAFALIWSAKDHKLYGLDGSGIAPAALSAETVRAAGFEEMPTEGWLPVMVPGAPAAWAAASKRFGALTMEKLAEAAASYAEEGFPLPVNPARLWAEETERFIRIRDQAEHPEIFDGFFHYFTKDGKPYRAGELVRNPDYAETIREIAGTGGESFYRGALMKKIVAYSKAAGGFFQEDDFRNYQAQWREPISTDYRGYTVYEMPPNGHGITVLMALNILGGFQPGERDSADQIHRMIEAVKLAFTDAKEYVADPRYMRTKAEDMLSAGYADRRRAEIGEEALDPAPGQPDRGGTVYFCAADGEGNMVSWIQSNYMEFGSGIVIPGTAISLQNRGVNFSLDPASDNVLAGGKKSYHTIIPGFLAKDGEAVGPFGVMGGFMQPQGQVQVLVNTIDYGMNPQEALDAPRFQWMGGRVIEAEPEMGEAVIEELKNRGHLVQTVDSRIRMGRGQIIWRNEDGVLCGGTEPRADGSIAVY